ncbi:type VI secretion system secreted protein VgrG [Acinetobacter calcoaceticus]|uniref:Type VI secretion system secreted protein VgrG n=1 Tax=Acinetobacter calcoaceticus TaxID=471 RepID=A0A4R1Y5B9_ACICA|nr:type VI secretion system secreted protein VgrG [Acinetobacter calcoaceticus]
MNIMLNPIEQILEKFGLSAQKRAIHIQFSNPDLSTQVFLHAIHGQHALNQGLKVELICLSTRADIALKQFIASQVAVDVVTDQGQLLRISGLITAAEQGQSDGALTVYKLSLEDGTTLWKRRRNSRVFMNKSAVEVIEVLFKEWQQKSTLFAASLSLDLSGLNQDYDIRPFIMQSNESDADFLQRLMREEGINWLIDEAELFVEHNNQSIQAQKLRLIDDNSHFQALQRRSIRFHRSNATEQQDSMTRFTAQRSLEPTSVHVQRWQADQLEQEEGAGSVLSAHQHSSNQDNAALGLEQAWHFSPAWMQDLNAEDQATASSNRQLERFNQQLSHAYAAQAKQFTATTTVRDAQVGYWFELNQHPEIDLHNAADRAFLITAKTFYHQNNLPKDLNDQVQQLLQHSQWEGLLATDPAERQANHLTLQRRNIVMVPTFDPLIHRPAAHPQRARVVGPTTEEIHVDAWGRIKVRFLFTRSEDHAHDGGAGSNLNDTDSAWVDVLTPWAGEGYGARFLPRIGEIVVIDFFDGNIDRPFVVGRIHEAQRTPTQFDRKGQLPATKKLSGIRSQEVGGSGFGQLRFDDTTGQISSQLQNSHGATQLNLGHLSHPKDQAESDSRGEGFELRSDQWGAVRAGKGLLLSSHMQDQASGVHLDASPAKQQIESNLNSSQALSEVAKNQQTDPLEVLDKLKGFIDQIEQENEAKAKSFKQALMLLSAPNSIALSSNEDIHLAAKQQISFSAGESINLSTQKNLLAHAQDKISLFAAQQGARLIAAKGKVEIQAQGDEMDLIARKKLQVISTEESIDLIASQKIVLTAGGSQIEISAAGILIKTNAKFEAKAGQHVFLGGESVALALPYLPRNELYSHQFLLKDRLGNILNDTPYSLTLENGIKLEGISNQDGLTQRVMSEKKQNIKIKTEIKKD